MKDYGRKKSQRHGDPRRYCVRCGKRAAFGLYCSRGCQRREEAEARRAKAGK